VTNEGILVKLYSLIPETWLERAGALRGERSEGWRRGELGDSCGNRKRERPEAGTESHFIRSQEVRRRENH